MARVAASRRSLNLEHVPPELDQDFLLQAGAERYQGFLGVPVVHKTRVQGVLLVRQHEARRFDDADEAMLTTLAVQLGRRDRSCQRPAASGAGYVVRELQAKPR